MIQNLINGQIETLCSHNESLVGNKADATDIAVVTESIIKLTKTLQEIQNDELSDPAYPVEKVAKLLDVSTQKVRELCKTGEIPSYRVEEGSYIKIRASRLNQFILKREKIERGIIEERRAVIELEENRKNRKINQVS